MAKKQRIILSILGACLIFAIAGILLSLSLGRGKFEANVTQMGLQVTPIYNHIKTFASIYSWPNEQQKTWLKQHIDMGTMPDQKTTNIGIRYVNWSDLDRGGQDFTDFEKYFNDNDLNLEDAFIHYAKDVDIPARTQAEMALGQRYTAMKEDKFLRVLSTNGPLWQSGADAKYGTSLGFDGVNDQIINGSAINSKINNEITLETWIKPGSKHNATILGWNGNQNALWIDDYGRLVMEINVDGQRRDTISRYQIPAENAWYHVVGIGNANTGKTQLYINGTEYLDQWGQKTTYAPGHITNLTNDLRIGSASSWFYYEGIIDEAKIYNRALTADEVLARYQNNTAISNGLIGNWRFDEGSGDKINDSGSFDFDSIIVYPDKSAQAYGDYWDSQTTYTLNLGEKLGEGAYIGNPQKIREVNVHLSQGADATWHGTWEYWNGSAWATLSAIDTTNDMQQKNGRISFTPPSDWAKTDVNRINLYWLRLRCTNISSQPPIAQAIKEIRGQYEWKGTSALSGEKYATKDISGTQYLVVPGWNANNDIDGDGYVNDNELIANNGNLVDPEATARLKYLARLPSRYFTDRWVMNYSNNYYRQYAADQSYAIMTAAKVDGVFIDNASPYLHDYTVGKSSYIEYPDPVSFVDDEILLLRGIKQKISPGEVICNMGRWVYTYPEVTEPIDGFMFENQIKYSASRYDTPNYLINEQGKFRSFSASGKKMIIHADANPTFWDNPELQNNISAGTLRDNMVALARYYLIATNMTYFDYQNGSNYARPWDDWFEAIEFDIGQPTGDFYIYDSSQSNYPSQAPTNLVKNGNFETISGATPPTIPNDWRCGVWAGNVSCRIANIAKTGSHSIELEASNNGIGGAFQYVTLKPNATYTLSAWIKTENLTRSDGAPIQLYTYAGPDTNWNLQSGGTTIGGTRDWLLVSRVFKTGNNTTGAYVYAGQTQQSNGKAWIDDVRLEEGEYPVNLIYARKFTKGLVLLKPMPESGDKALGDSTASTHKLDRTYYPVNSDGTFGEGINEISLKNYQGAILSNTLVPTINEGDLQNVTTADPSTPVSIHAEPNVKIRLLLDNQPTSDWGQTDGNGNWSALIGHTLAYGAHRLVAEATNQRGIARSRNYDLMVKYGISIYNTKRIVFGAEGKEATLNKYVRVKKSKRPKLTFLDVANTRRGKNNNRGVVSYLLNGVRSPGKYYVWAKVYYPDSRSNSIKLKLDNQRSILMEDRILKKWHWVKLRYRLNIQNKHTLRLIFREDGARVDKIIFTKSRRYRPK